MTIKLRIPEGLQASVEVGGQGAQAAAPGGGVHVLGLADGARLVVATLGGRPCAACTPVTQLLGSGPPHEPRPGGGEPASPAAAPHFGPPEVLLFGALLASEALGALWLPVVEARVQVVDLRVGGFTGRSLPRTAGCRLCRERP